MRYKEKSSLLLAAWLLLFPISVVQGETVGCDGVVIDAATKGIKIERAAPVDVYIASRMSMEAPRNSFFKVYRPETVREGTDRKHPLKLYLGRLQVIDVQDDILIGRMIEFASAQENPRVRYETFMVGDCLQLEYEDRPLEVGAAKLEAEPLDLPRLEPEPFTLPEMEIAAPAEIPFEIPVVRRVIPTKLLFKFDSALIEDEWHDELAQLAEFIKEREPVWLIVEGHACSIGSEEYNVNLSRRRAQAVIDYLTNRHGIRKDIFEIKAYGESRPEASNETEEGRRENRRAATLILYEAIPATEEMLADHPITVAPDALVPEDAEVPPIPREPAVAPQREM